MVRATIAFAVVALGAAAVIAQAPEGTSQLEARDFNNDLELREYVVDDLEARGDLEDVIDIDAREPEVFFEEVDAREPEFFDDIEARDYEAEELEARDFEEEEFEARAPAPPPAADDPSKTVTITASPTPTACTSKELKTQKEQKKVDKALSILRSAKGKKDLSRKQKQQVKRARKYLRRVKSRRVRAAKRTAKKCSSALRKAGLSSKKCQDGASCDSALTGKGISSTKCKAASKYLQRVSGSKKSRKSTSKSKRSSKKSAKLLEPTKTTVGEDGVTTVTVNAGPTCTSGSSSKSRLRKRLTIRDIADEEFDSLFAREYEFDDLD
jgi:hypothetical protein